MRMTDNKNLIISTTDGSKILGESAFNPLHLKHDGQDFQMNLTRNLYLSQPLLYFHDSRNIHGAAWVPLRTTNEHGELSWAHAVI